MKNNYNGGSSLNVNNTGDSQDYVLYPLVGESYLTVEEKIQAEDLYQYSEYAQGINFSISDICGTNSKATDLEQDTFWKLIENDGAGND